MWKPSLGENTYFLYLRICFEVTDWVEGSTQNVSLPKDVFLRKESE